LPGCFLPSHWEQPPFLPKAGETGTGLLKARITPVFNSFRGLTDEQKNKNQGTGKKPSERMNELRYSRRSTGIIDEKMKFGPIC
jgi:hypothetical protein